MAVSLISTGLSGDILNSGMPSFCTKATDASNVTGNADTWPADASAASNLSVNTERFDLGGDVAGMLFTAPVTGRYRFAFIMNLAGGTSSNASYGNAQIRTSNRNYALVHSYDWWNYPSFGSGVNYIFCIHGQIFTEMEANDTAHATIRIFGSNKGFDVSSYFFMGHLIC